MLLTTHAFDMHRGGFAVEGIQFNSIDVTSETPYVRRSATTP